MASWIRESTPIDAEAGASRSAGQRLADALGAACLVVALVLSFSGVRIARADDAAEANMSIDPSLAREMEAAKAERPRAIARPGRPAEAPELRPGVAAVEIAPGVIRLNTRGYNYRSAAGGVDVAPAVPEATVPSAPAAPAPDEPAD